MSDFSLILVLHLKTSKIINGMAKVQIKSEKITPFGGIFYGRELFSRFNPLIKNGSKNRPLISLKYGDKDGANRMQKACFLLRCSAFSQLLLQNYQLSA